MSENKGLSIQFQDFDTPAMITIEGKRLYIYPDSRSSKKNLRFYIKCDRDIQIVTPYTLYKQKQQIIDALNRIEKINNEINSSTCNPSYLFSVIDDVKSILEGKK